eukprot:COSAG02_NODE_588_length_19902_cov_115.928900_21_plen_146_part_00
MDHSRSDPVVLRTETAEVMFRQVNKISQHIEYYVHFEECALPNQALFAVDSFRVTRALTHDAIRSPLSGTCWAAADNKRLDEWVEKEQMDFTKVKKPEDQKEKKKDGGNKKRKKKKKKDGDDDDGERSAAKMAALAVLSRLTCHV